VIAFDDLVEVLPETRMVDATDRTRFRAVEELGKVQARGGTELARPLQLAVRTLAGGHDDRERVIVLVTDGEPNLDLRPYCEGPGGDCPYDNKPEETAFDLATAALDKRVRTFVIGLASPKPKLLDGTTEFDCAGMSTADLSSASGPCNTMLGEPAVQVCCTLHRIAYNGGTTRARFGDTKKTLREALSAVMSSVTPPAASRTLPVFATVTSATSGRGEAFRFFTGFNAQPFDLWSGIIERQRFVCSDSLVPEPQTIEATLGDDFAVNVNSAPGDRHFISVEREATGGAIHSARSIRPRITATTNDGAGAVGGTQLEGGTKDANRQAFANEIDSRAMSIDATTCPDEPDLADCKQLIMEWNVGLTNAEDESRCGPSGVDCNLVADVYHSTPAVVSRPSAFIRDETYDRFAIANASRPLVLYTSTNDGVLHAFRADRKTTGNNELWAFIPPAVLPTIKSQYARTHQQLLDGVPVVKDVVAKLNDDNINFDFERGIAAARGATGTWRTVLVQSFGFGRPGYFAMDITDPLPSTEAGKGPRFLWQLTTDDSGNPLFGTGGGTPAITTVLLQDGDDTKEVAVAVLPGGPGGPGTAGSGSGCLRTTASLPWIENGWEPRQNVRCYEGTGKEGRSLTIVRLDTGQILKTFRKDTADVPAGVAAASSGNLVTVVPELVSPITGTPVAFPGQVGAVADRIFVGDADGTLWRVNLSSTNPTEWTMRIFWDGYPSGTKSHQFGDGQPIMVPPVVSLDPFGNVTVAFSTGDQDVLTPTTGMTTYLWSLKEVPNNDGTDLVTQLNWYLGGPGDAGDERRFLNGERVTGPISLFNEGLYFTTYKAPDPNSSDRCENGATRLWGVHYLNRNNATAPDEGGQPVLPRPGVSPIEVVQVIPLADLPDVPDDATVFGASIVQLPTCFDDRTGAEDDVDPYTGTGMHRAVTNVTPGSFQLVMHTGSGGNTDTGGKIGVTQIDLPTPSSVTRIDSWAAIVE
jgi:type IV pilus assembly protein PilY1